MEKLPKRPAGLGCIPLPSSELALHTEVESCWGCVVTGSSANVWRGQVGITSWELGEGRAGTVGWAERGWKSVLVLTDNIERVNQRVELIPYALQGVADRLRAVQELDAVGVGLVFHREGPLDMRRVAPAREGCGGLGTRDGS